MMMICCYYYIVISSMSSFLQTTDCRVYTEWCGKTKQNTSSEWESWFVDERHQWRMAKLAWADRKDTVTQISTTAIRGEQNSISERTCRTGEDHIRFHTFRPRTEMWHDREYWLDETGELKIGKASSTKSAWNKLTEFSPRPWCLYCKTNHYNYRLGCNPQCRSIILAPLH